MGCTTHPMSKVVPGSVPSQAARMLGVWGLSKAWLGVQGADRTRFCPERYIQEQQTWLSRTFWRGRMSWAEDTQGTGYLQQKAQLASGLLEYSWEVCVFFSPSSALHSP